MELFRASINEVPDLHRKRKYAHNFRCKSRSSRGLTVVLQDAESEVPGDNINLFCMEPESSLDDIWDQPFSSSKRVKKKTLPHEIDESSPASDVPPNSPVLSSRNAEPKNNLYISHLLKIWSQQTFNSPKVSLITETLATNEDSESLTDSPPVLVFRDENSEFNSDAENINEPCWEDSNFQLVPDLEISSEVENGFEGGNSNLEWRELRSCVSYDHIVPNITFVEE